MAYCQAIKAFAVLLSCYYTRLVQKIELYLFLSNKILVHEDADVFHIR